jgi:hypothetical protein
MFRCVPLRFRSLAAVLLLAGMTLGCLAQEPAAPKRGRKYKAPPPTALVVVTVLRASNEKPVVNASVIFHPIVNGKDAGNMELKTNDDGKAKIDLLALNSDVRIQVIAPGFQTWGEDYKIDKDKVGIEIKLLRPQDQYSIYKKHDAASTTPDDASKPDAAKPDAAKPDAAPEATPKP